MKNCLINTFLEKTLDYLVNLLFFKREYKKEQKDNLIRPKSMSFSLMIFKIFKIMMRTLNSPLQAKIFRLDHRKIHWRLFARNGMQKTID